MGAGWGTTILCSWNDHVEGTTIPCSWNNHVVAGSHQLARRLDFVGEKTLSYISRRGHVKCVLGRHNKTREEDRV